MAALIAEGLSLVFPLSRSGTPPEEGSETQRLVRDARGRAVGVSALTDISFALESGDRLGVIGRNGSGKTTLLQVLAEILPPTAGRLEIEGRVTSLLNINLGTQAEATGAHNITLRGLAAGWTRDAIEARRADIVAFADLGEFIDLPLTAYSAGMRMRLNFAIATAFAPDILLLDEWLSAGDAAFAEAAAERMDDFVGQAGIMVLASHNRRLLRRTCNKVLWLDRGHARAYGAPGPVIKAYKEELLPASAPAGGPADE